MPLIDGYGVLIGDLRSYSCDNGNDPRQYYHCNIVVSARGRSYRCAVNLDTKKQGDALRWRVLKLERQDIEMVSALPEGWHALDSSPGSGALDYLRSPELHPTTECRPSGTSEMGDIDCIPWQYGSSLDAFGDLEPVISNAARLYVYGEPFRIGRGVHNIHQNQGDPSGSRWSEENGTWQDGAIAGLQHSGEVLMFLSRFATQADRTDDQGRPISS